MTVGDPDEQLKLNDGKVDSQGRLWIGSLTPQTNPTVFEFVGAKGSLYLINKNKSYTTQVSGIKLSNGLTWNPEDTKFYYVDTMKLRVDKYDYDPNTGKLSNERTAFDLRENNIGGYADGMTMDNEGKLWIAIFGSGMVVRVDPVNGKLLSSIKFPTLQITSVCFGGSNYDELFVTTGNFKQFTEFDKEYSKEEICHPLNGSCFRVTNLGIKGMPSLSVKL
uniref:SMP-30/Gluconolactonase/LRE-like region domain-containing protein n=1 Tax=Clastoptera arizonana TaxID=38151 RepID=A0A1B6DI06_9HEMI